MKINIGNIALWHGSRLDMDGRLQLSDDGQDWNDLKLAFLVGLFGGVGAGGGRATVLMNNDCYHEV